MSKSQLNPGVESAKRATPFLGRESVFTKGRVYSVIMDENHFFFRDVLGEFDPTFIGYLYWGKLNLKQGGISKEDIIRYCFIAKPYFNWLNYTPLNTEIIDVIKAPSNKHYSALGGTHTNVEFYYLPPINIWNNSSGNPLPSEPDVQESNGILPLGEYTLEEDIMENKNLLPFEGDLILEGRFGNSIRFGSTNPRGKNNWSENDSKGDPITIISNGKTTTGAAAIENINEDDSSIYLTSNQNINNFSVASKNFKSLNANFTEPLTSTEGLEAFVNSSTSIEELLNGDFQNTDPGDADNPDTITEGENPSRPPDQNQPNEEPEEIDPQGEGYEDFVKFSGKYKDNNKNEMSLYLVPKRFAYSGQKIVAEVLKDPLREMLLDAEAEGVTLKIRSGFRTPYDDIYLNGKLIAQSQKTLRIQNIKSAYKGKLKEPWLKRTTCISPFTFKGENFDVGDRVTGVNGSNWFNPRTAPAGRSNHGVSLAIDFNTAKAGNSTFVWLSKNSYKYGFIRTVSTEDWHFDYKPELAIKGATAKLKYTYQPGKSYAQTTNLWNNVFGANEPNYNEELVAFQEQKVATLFRKNAQQLNNV